MIVEVETAAGSATLDLVQLKRDLARKHFKYFVRLMKPEWGWPMTWFHEHICNVLNDWYRSGDEYSLMIEMPPGHAKSWYTKLFVCWVLGIDRTTKAAYTSYNTDLAESQAAHIRDVMESDAYREIFPRSALDTRHVGSRKKGTGEMDRTPNNRSEFRIPKYGGGLRAGGVAKGLSGHRLDLGIVDDPDKDPAEARSAAEQRAKYEWYTSVLRTRKDAGRPLRLIMVLTRWHMSDLAGRVLEADGVDWETTPYAWRRVRFPALKVGPPTPEDPRQDGEPLWPSGGFDAAHCNAIRRLDPISFEALWQQNPVPEGGALILATHLTERWRQLGALLNQPGRWVQSWDFRNDGKDLKRSSQVAAHLYFEPALEPGRAYLVDKRGGPWTPDESLAQFDVIQNDPLWARAQIRLIEAKADGRMILSLRQRKYGGMTPIEPKTDKVQRTRDVLPFLAAHNVIAPADDLCLPWWPQVVGDLLAFPNGAHDDDVDCLTQYLSWRYLAPVDKTPASNPLDRLRARQGLK